ncbi:MAG: nucleotide sugar dehydrogenase [Deltaproteobacteria bacterium]|nr:nucleotide sugar dehydrogenase [Deltaproteobacteria bacterium]
MNSFRPDVTIIGGCGHVGFPLGLIFAQAGKKVALLDINQENIKKIQNGIPPFKEAGAQPCLKEVLKNKTLHCTTDPNVISASTFVICVTGTPLDEYLNPRIDAVLKILEQYFPYFKSNQILILRSTLFPSTSEKVSLYFRKKKLDVHVTYCPERIAEGYALEEFKSLPQIISGFTDYGIQNAQTLFSSVTNKFILLSPLEAELTKLFTNTYRYIHFSISNAFYQMASHHNLDFKKIYHAITHEYPRMASFPKPGFTAGPCLLKDTMQLSVFAPDQFPLGQAARLINEGMPLYIFDQIRSKMDISAMNVGILGMAFKGESDDSRDSLSYKLMKILKLHAKKVLCSDEYILNDFFLTKEELIERSDIIIVGTPHNAYGSLNLRDKVVYDIWGVLKYVQS